MIEPLNKYVLIEVEDDAEKTNGGLYVPQGSNVTAVDILKKGTAINVSEKVSEVKVGDVVYYNRHAITKVPGNEKQVLVRVEDLYGRES